jgi:thiol-disulfide isomerase/thioredoxin
MRQFDRRILRLAAALGSLALFTAAAASAGDLTRAIRMKLSAGDLASGEAAAEDWKREHGEDAEYLDGLGWLARGAELLGQDARALELARDLRKRIGGEQPELLLPWGAAIEVEGRVIAGDPERGGRGEAIRFYERELAAAKDTALRSRIAKNLNLLALEGSPAPAIDFGDRIGPASPALAELRGRPALLFFWAHWCGDCKAQAGAVARIAAKYASRGLAVVAPTRYYGTGKENQPVDREAERARIVEVLAESYPGFEAIPVPIDEAAMIRYGASATPTFALVDRQGIVRFYTPTRLSEAELERRIERLLAE